VFNRAKKFHALDRAATVTGTLINYHLTDRIGVAVTLLAGIQEIFGSNLSRDPGCLD
jgi:hypothetical protein